jgi:hypothetical protein
VKQQHKEIVLSYVRVFLAAVLALYLAGESDLAMLWQAGVAAVLPPLIRWLNPNDPAYGRTRK